MDRFDLEQAFMECWTTKEDISLICESVLDGKLSNDELANALIGLHQLHELRCSKAFSIFERLISSGQIKSDFCGERDIYNYNHDNYYYEADAYYDDEEEEGV